jgi:hypothetical protein
LRSLFYEKNRLIYFRVFAFLIASVFFVSCAETNGIKCDNPQSGLLKSFTGLDGCGWVISLSDNTIIEPVNLDDFDIELEENKSVSVRYHQSTGMQSSCMAGEIVEIDYIK